MKVHNILVKQFRHDLRQMFDHEPTTEDREVAMLYFMHQIKQSINRIDVQLRIQEKLLDRIAEKEDG